MVEQAHGLERDKDDRSFDMRALWRLAIWGAAATAGLAAVVLAANTNVGSQRLMTAMAPADRPAQCGGACGPLRRNRKRDAAAVGSRTAARRRPRAAAHTHHVARAQPRRHYRLDPAPGYQRASEMHRPNARAVFRLRRRTDAEPGEPRPAVALQPPFRRQRQPRAASLRFPPATRPPKPRMPSLKSRWMSAARSISTGCVCCGTQPKAPTPPCSKTCIRSLRYGRTAKLAPSNCDFWSGRSPIQKRPQRFARRLRASAASANRRRSKASSSRWRNPKADRRAAPARRLTAPPKAARQNP